jgi:hypothetical protein
MAAFRNFPGKTQGWLETELEKVLADQAAGKTVVEYSGGDSSGKELIAMSTQRRKDMILSDLNQLAPSTYPRVSTIAARRTRARYA